jgi:hypothetical protein
MMVDAVHRYNGSIVQSTADGIFALLGAPVAHEDHPQRALRAAVRMQEVPTSIIWVEAICDERTRGRIERQIYRRGITDSPKARIACRALSCEGPPGWRIRSIR